MNPLRLNPVGPFTTITTTPTQQSGLPPRHDSSWSVPSLATARTSNPPVRQRATRERQWSFRTLPTIQEEEEEEETDERGAERREEEKQKEGQKKKKGVREYVFLLGGPGLTVPVTRRKRSVCRSRARRVWRFCTHFFVGTKMSGPARLVFFEIRYIMVYSMPGVDCLDYALGLWRDSRTRDMSTTDANYLAFPLCRMG